MSTLQIHGNCVALNGQCVLIRGKSGSGKSDLTLQLIDSAGYGLGDHVIRGTLVADDQVILTRVGDHIITNPPDILAGKLEIRGQGIVDLRWVGNLKLALIVDLTAKSKISRMPVSNDLTTELLGLYFPRIYLDATHASAAARVRSFLR
jgi:HPr kinase/phosphorylase